MDQRPTIDNMEFNTISADLVMKLRFGNLEKLKPLLSLKTVYKLTEKLESEQSAFSNLLNAKTEHNEILSSYSFPLDPQFFEQYFLPEIPK